jgi:hypothetical protein
MQEIDNFDIGDKVKHPKFGTGTVMFRTGEGDKQKVTVKFGSDVGEKKLLVSLANLKLISERPTLAPEAPVEAVPGRTRLAKVDEDEDEDAEADVADDEDEEAEEEEEFEAEDEDEE